MTDQSRPRRSSPRWTVTTAVAVALACFGFAVVNVVFELTDHLARGRYAEYAAAFTVMNWFVIVLKLVGAAVALLSVTPRQRLLPGPALTVLLWGAFSTLGIYALGSVVQAVGIGLGLTGDRSQIDVAGIAYVLFFLLMAAGFGPLAVSYSRRNAMPKRLAVLGGLGGPLMLALVLVAMPALLVALSLMPSSTP